MSLQSIIEVLDSNEGIRRRYYLLVESFLFGFEDANPPPLDDNRLTNDILRLINVLPCYVSSRYFLDLYCSLNSPWIFIQVDASPSLFVLDLAALGFD